MLLEKIVGHQSSSQYMYENLLYLNRFRIHKQILPKNHLHKEQMGIHLKTQFQWDMK